MTAFSSMGQQHLAITTAGSAPPISIGLPVYNGGRFLAQCIESLLSQTFPDFELIISDNASSDDSGEICARFAAHDRRIVYVRQERNIGAVANWNYVVHAARGRFFKWASANDYCAPEMLERCISVLREQPDVVVSYGGTSLIDDDGSALGDYPHDLQLVEEEPSARFSRVCRELRLNNAQCGLIRLDVLRLTGMERSFPGGDIGLMAELALYGRFRKLPVVLLYRRMGKASATRFLSGSELGQFLNPAATPRRQMVAWLTHLDYAWSVLRAPIGFRERVAALAFVLRSFYWSRKALLAELRDQVLRQQLT